MKLDNLIEYHRIFGILFCIPLLWSFITGGLYWVLLNICQYERSTVRWLIKYHSLSVISLKRIYPPIVGIIGIIVIISALYTAFKKIIAMRRLFGFGRALRANRRMVHITLGLFIMIPLFIACFTGTFYALSKLMGFPMVAKFFISCHLGACKTISYTEVSADNNSSNSIVLVDNPFTFGIELITITVLFCGICGLFVSVYMMISQSHLLKEYWNKLNLPIYIYSPSLIFNQGYTQINHNDNNIDNTRDFHDHDEDDNNNNYDNTHDIPLPRAP